MSDTVGISIIERLAALGYDETQFPEGNNVWDKLVKQPKELTDRGKSSQPALDAHPNGR